MSKEMRGSHQGDGKEHLATQLRAVGSGKELEALNGGLGEALEALGKHPSCAGCPHRNICSLQLTKRRMQRDSACVCGRGALAQPWRAASRSVIQIPPSR